MLCLFYTPWYAALWWPILFRVLLVFKFSSVECVNVRFKCVYLLCVFGVWYPPVFQVYFSSSKSRHHQNPKLTEKKLILKILGPNQSKNLFCSSQCIRLPKPLKLTKWLPSWIMIWNFYKCQIFVYCTLVCGMSSQMCGC